MDRKEKAKQLFEQGYNCCQSVLAAFSDDIALSEDECLSVGGGFGRGMGTGEICGAVSGAVMALGMLCPADRSDPEESKRRAVANAQELQQRFKERFGCVRCEERLAKRASEGLVGRCTDEVCAAVELVEEMIAARK